MTHPQTITHLIHPSYRAPQGFAAVTEPLHKASTIFYPDVAAMLNKSWQKPDSYTYGLNGTPTTFALQAKIAQLEGAKHGILVSSGLAAIALVNLACLQRGDTVLLPPNLYAPGRDMFTALLEKFDLHYQIYDPLDASKLAALITPKTKLLWLEAAGSSSLEFPDLCGLVAVARQHGLLTALDNTWGAGLAFSPFNLPFTAAQRAQGGLAKQSGVDISIHALTKYPSGGADVLMGSICCQDDKLYGTLKNTYTRLGFGVGVGEIELILRGLPTIAARYRIQDEACRVIMAYLAQHPLSTQLIDHIFHPSLPSTPGHTYWQQVCPPSKHTGRSPQGAAAALFSIIFKPHISTEHIHRFCEHLSFFKLGWSWAGPASLCAVYALQAHVKQRLQQSYPHNTLVRLAIGMEDTQDLCQDLDQALSHLAKLTNA